MRILHAIQELGIGGAERVVVALARGARRAGHDVDIASAPGKDLWDVPGERFELPLIERRPWRMLSAAVSLDRALRHARPDVTHFHNPGMAAVGALATLRGARVPGIVTMHGVPDEDYRAAARIFRLARLPVIACGPGVAEGLRDQGFDVAATIVNGIAAAPPPADRRRLCTEWRLPPERPLVLSVGRLAPVKDHSLAIRAAAQIPSLSLVIVGDGPLRNVLEDESAALGVSDRVVFAGPRIDARELIGAADAVVLCSRSEGMPLTALETLAAGTPLVATEVRGTREFLVDGVGCVLVPPKDENAVAAGLRRLLEDHELAERMARLGPDFAARWPETDMVAAYLKFYREVARS